MRRIPTCLTRIGLALALAAASGLRADPPVVPLPGLEGHSIKPIPLTTGNLDPRKMALGKALFSEKLLSRDNTISCASCHDLRHGGADGRPHSIGIGGAEGQNNAPTVFNSGLNSKQFWDGRASTLEEQLDFPLQAANEMGSTWTEIIGKLNAAPIYAAEFRRSYPNGVRPENVRNALAEFERSLTTPNSRFDKFLRGDVKALNADEQAGYEKFTSYGCSSCHQGVNVGGNMFGTLGSMEDYFVQRGHITKTDYGRFNVTGREQDRFVFKVPSLRNVALTAPYFHDGSIESLEDAVEVMGRFQLGQALSAEDVHQLVSFLGTLTGEYRGAQP